MNALTLIFLAISLLFGVLMYLQAYGWNRPHWQCLLFALVSALVMLLVLSGCKSLIMKLVGKLSALAHSLMDLI